MKFYIAAVLALGLCGCSNVDLFGDRDETVTPIVEQSPPPAGEQTAAETAAPESPAAATAAVPSGPPAVSAARSSAPPSAVVSARCKHLARLRAGDAAFQGEDPDTQEAVYNGTYRDCVAWDAAHRS